VIASSISARCAARAPSAASAGATVTAGELECDDFQVTVRFNVTGRPFVRALQRRARQHHVGAREREAQARLFCRATSLFSCDERRRGPDRLSTTTTSLHAAPVGAVLCRRRGPAPALSTARAARSPRAGRCCSLFHNNESLAVEVVIEDVYAPVADRRAVRRRQCRFCAPAVAVCGDPVCADDVCDPTAVRACVLPHRRNRCRATSAATTASAFPMRRARRCWSKLDLCWRSSRPVGAELSDIDGRCVCRQCDHGRGGAVRNELFTGSDGFARSASRRWWSPSGSGIAS
jgi:hypothetical protein